MLQQMAIAIMYYTYMIAFTCFFTNNMYYFPTCISGMEVPIHFIAGWYIDSI